MALSAVGSTLLAACGVKLGAPTEPPPTTNSAATSPTDTVIPTQTSAPPAPTATSLPWVRRHGTIVTGHSATGASTSIWLHLASRFSVPCPVDGAGEPGRCSTTRKGGMEPPWRRLLSAEPPPCSAPVVSPANDRNNHEGIGPAQVRGAADVALEHGFSNGTTRGE